MDLRAQPCCPICDGVGRSHVGRRADLTIPALASGERPTTEVDVVRCRGCGHYYCDPLPMPEELSRLYADASGYFAGTPDQRVAGAHGWLDWIESEHLASGRLLDVGSGDGALLAAAAARGWTAVGIEPTEQFAAEASARGLDVHVGYLDDDFTVDEPFDVVSALAVLEHVPDPLVLLARARAVLRTGGVIVVEVPNGRRPDGFLVDRALRLRGMPWTVRTAPLQPPFHLSEFTRRSLITAFRRSGFEPSSIRAVHGRVPYPLPAGILRGVRIVERVGSAFGAGLNLTAVAVAV